MPVKYDQELRAKAIRLSPRPGGVRQEARPVRGLFVDIYVD